MPIFFSDMVTLFLQTAGEDSVFLLDPLHPPPICGSVLLPTGETPMVDFTQGGLRLTKNIGLMLAPRRSKS